MADDDQDKDNVMFVNPTPTNVICDTSVEVCKSEEIILGEPYVAVLYVVYLRDVQWIQEHRSALNVQTSNTRNVGTNSKSANMIVLRN